MNREKFKIIGYKFNGLSYANGSKAARMGMNECPAYCFKHPKTNECVLVHSFYNEDGTKAKKSREVIVKADGEKYSHLIYNDKALRLYESGYDLLRHIKYLPGCELITESYTENILPSLDGATFELKSGDEICLDEFGIFFTQPVLNDCQLILDGNNIKEVITELKRRSDDPYYNVIPSLTGYKITVPFAKNEDLETCTDIGGCYLCVKRDEVLYTIVHLHNGFGDGNYTLRFRGHMLVR